MFNINNITFAVMHLIDPAVTGADYFNYFFTEIVVVGLFAFGVNILVKMISRS